MYCTIRVPYTYIGCTSFHLNSSLHDTALLLYDINYLLTDSLKCLKFHQCILLKTRKKDLFYSTSPNPLEPGF